MGRDGFISLRGLFWIVFLASAIYAGYMLAPPFFTYQMIKFEVDSEADNAHYNKDEDIRKNILYRTGQWGIPLLPENLKIERRADEIEISMSYEVELIFFDKYKRTLYYDIDIVKPIKSKEASKY